MNLIEKLLDGSTYACRTFRVNRGEFPKRFKEPKVETIKSTYLKVGTIRAVNWKDKRDVFVISSIHGNDETTVQRHKTEIKEPVMIQCYNNNMGGFDRSNLTIV